MRPNADAGYAACENASSTSLPQGDAAVRARVPLSARQAGCLSRQKAASALRLSQQNDGIIVAACFAVNAFGDVFDHTTGNRLAGMTGISVYDALMQGASQDNAGKNTTIGIIGTNAVLTKEQAKQTGGDGDRTALQCACVRHHTMFDGDTVFAFGTGQKPCEINAVLAAGAEVSARAIENAIANTEGVFP